MATPTEAEAAAVGKLAWLWLALALAALLSSWNPFAAPAGLVVGLASALLGLWALRRRRGHRWAAAGALALGALAAVVSGLVLALTAGAVTGELGGEPVVRGRSAAEAGALLDAARASTEPARQRARKALDAASGAAATPRESPREDAPLEPGAPPAGGRAADEPE